ncbi:unnamed protein product [marine sediment metagenome]|uniref:Uncharacterized protein n=1 Tax=marine sediment metagenome TaxID=412755 RepID=X0YV93_9ZZZZ
MLMLYIDQSKGVKYKQLYRNHDLKVVEDRHNKLDSNLLRVVNAYE